MPVSGVPGTGTGGHLAVPGQAPWPEPGHGHKQAFCATLRPNQLINDLFLILDLIERPGRRGDPYLVLTLGDRTGRLLAFADRPSWPVLPGGVVQVRGHTRRGRRELELIARSLRPALPGTYDVGDFTPTAPEPAADYLRRLNDMIDAVTDRGYRRFLRGVLSGQRFLDRFCKAPASVAHHHAYEGGLLQHTVEIMEGIVRLFPGLGQPLDLNLLLALGFCHDLGKIDAYTLTYPYRLTPLGQTWGHEALGLRLVFRTLDVLPVLPAAASGRLVGALSRIGAPHKHSQIPEVVVVTALDGLGAGLWHAQDGQGGPATATVGRGA